MAGIIKLYGMPKTCLVIPLYNEEKRFEKHAFEMFIKSNPDFSLILVDDGSKDRTAEIIREFATENPSQVFIKILNINSGKAEAVRVGIKLALNQVNYNYIGFLDADLSTPIDSMIEFVNYAENYHYDMIIGSRIKRIGSIIIRNPIRHYLGRIFSTFASIILDLPVYDTQCGAKLFKASQIANLFDVSFNSKWIFDVEILARWKQEYGKERTLNSIYEYPLHKWTEVGDSRLKLKHLISIPLEMISIYRHYNR